jgi:hypothetical protein
MGLKGFGVSRLRASKSPFISVTRRARRRPAPLVIVVLLVATVLLASFALPAFGLSPTKLISEALSTAKKADKDAKTAEKDAQSADKDAKNSTVGTSRLQDGAVTADKLANGAVTSAKLASGSVGSTQIVRGSVSIDDLSGTSTNTTFDLPEVDPNTCSTAEVPDADAAITDFPMISFPGPTSLPLEVSATVLRVDIAGSVRVKFCNGTGVDAAAVTGVNIEVVTLR